MGSFLSFANLQKKNKPKTQSLQNQTKKITQKASIVKQLQNKLNL